MFRTHAMPSIGNKFITALFILIMVISVTIIVFCLITGCSFAQDEPPLSLGKGDAEGLARNAELQEIKPDEGTITYKVQYLNPDYTTYAFFDFSTRALKQEIFPGQWIVIYEYGTRLDKLSQLPSKISIYQDAGDGQKGKLINVYDRERPVGQGMFLYRDKNDREKTIDCGYFQIIPSR